ncbi:MAG: protein kinase [Acidobacteriota bacterium]
MSGLPPHIGRYEIKSLIARGGMGDLCLAWDPKTDRLVAVKVLSERLDSIEFRARFDREVRALAALNHPNIVNIYDYDTGGRESSPFIVMEYVRGETLAEMIKRRAPLSVSQKLKLIAELCAGLAQAHEVGIIHRDIKPANLMVAQDGRLKILDFGIARVDERNGTLAGQPLTQVDMVIGTPGYMSPEQIEGGEIDHRSDIFSVGAVSYELFSNREAFSGPNTHQIERQVTQGQPVSLALLVPGLDPEISEVVLRALKKDPNKRYQDAATFEKALERLRLRLGPDAPVPAQRPTPPPPPGAKSTSRDPRADAAYQRSLAADQRGAPGAARRFVIEALAYDSSHVGARTLLARLDAPFPRPSTSQPVSRGETAASTAVNTSFTRTASETAVSTSVTQASSKIVAPPTIIVTPTDVRFAAGRPWYHAVWSADGRLRRRYERLFNRAGTSSGRPQREALWTQYRWAALAVGLLTIVVGIAAATISLVLGGPTAGQLLTVEKPENGTISAAGIACGTRDSNCSARRPNGELAEFTYEPDAGFAFEKYTGDCAPAGRTLMTSARTCGATFVKAAVVPTAPTYLLTIEPPQGGTLEGLDIICGTKGSVCSANPPEGALVELHATADAGFTFMGFLGDCSALGHTQMTSPRTCGARFVPAAIAAEPPAAPAAVARRAPGRPPPPSPANDAPPPVGDRPSSPGGPGAAVRGNSGGVGGGGGRAADAQTTRIDPAATVAPPPTPTEFAKGKILDVLKKYCDAHEAIDPVAVQRVYPDINMQALRNQLNTSRYKSVECKFAAPEFKGLDPEKGSAEVRAELTRVYVYTAAAEPKTDEQIATLKLNRPKDGNDWLISTIEFRPKPKPPK